MIPTDLSTNYFAPAYKVGARISSNSFGLGWREGWSHAEYSYLAVDMDEFVIAQPEMTILAAAGNAGNLGLYSVGIPSTGKNLLSVGASNYGATLLTFYCHNMILTLF
jgi:hypothetical protein